MIASIDCNILVGVRIRTMNSKELVTGVDLTRVEDNLIVIFGIK